MNRPTRSYAHQLAILLVVLMTSIALPQEPQQPNLIPNPGFERGEGNQPEAWSFYSWHDSVGTWETEHVHGRKRSIGMKGPNSGWSTTLPVEPGKIYSIRLHYRSEGGPSRIILYVRNLNAPRKEQVVLYKPHRTIDAQQHGTFVDGVYVDGADEKGWAPFEGGDFVPPEGVKSLRLLIKHISGNPDARVWIDDVVVTASEPRAVPETAKLLRTLDGAAVWTDSENRKILPKQEPPTGAPQDGIALAAARGECESFQIAVTPQSEWRDVQWSWGNFGGPGPLPASALRCRRVETIPIARPHGPYGHKGLNPDPLTERLPCTIPAQTNQSFWFTLRVPADLKPGRYETQLALSANGKEACRVPLRLRVRDFALPRRPSLDVRSGLRTGVMLKREQGEKEGILKRYYRNICEHRSRCTPGARVHVTVDGDRAAVDAAEYLAHLRFMRDELGVKRFVIPSLWIGHRGTHRMPRDAQWQRRPIFANDALTELNPEFEKPFRDYMGQLVKQIKDEGLFLSPSVRFIDEPNLNDEATVNGIRTLAKLLLDIDPGFTICMTASWPHPKLTDLSKLWVLHTDAWSRHYDRIKAAREAGCRIYVYNNAVNYPEHRPIRVRLWPWLLRKYAVDGTYSWWGTVCWRGEMEDPWTCGQGSSGVLLYPPRSKEEHGPIDSVRWELFREGLEDYEYMRLAEQLADRLEAAGKADAARKGRAAVAEALSLVERWPNVRAANDEPYTLDVEAVAQARAQLADAIEEMQKALK